MLAGSPAERLATRFQDWMGVVVWLLLAALAVQLWAWVGSYHRTRVDQSFDRQAQVSAGFTDTYLENLSGSLQQEATSMLSGPTITQRELELFSVALGFVNARVVDDQGRLIVNRPPAPALIGHDLRERLEYLRLALERNQPTVSDTYMSLVTKQPVVVLAVPFATPYGSRVFAGAYSVSQNPFTAYIRDVVSPPDGHGYYVDSAGNIVAASGRLGQRITPLSQVSPDLATALSRTPKGGFRKAGQRWRYTSARIRSTPWTVVIDVPEQSLYSQVDQFRRQLGSVLAAGMLLLLLATVISTTALHHRRRTEHRLRDLNQQRTRQAADLKAVNAELESFSSSVAHDLRAPLRAMTGYAEIVLDHHTSSDPDDRMPSEEVLRLLRRIRENAIKMSRLIDALLSFSRLQRQPIRTLTVDIAGLAQSAWDALSEQRTGRDIVFDLADLPPCQGDPDLLKQALTNLLDNAIKFTGKQPAAHIHVNSRPGPPGYATYRVQDDGAGFDPNEADQLFKPFQRLHPPGAYPGVGIGLSLVQRIITRHGGEITAQSVLGEGTTISFTLPVK